MDFRLFSRAVWHWMLRLASRQRDRFGLWRLELWRFNLLRLDLWRLDRWRQCWPTIVSIFLVLCLAQTSFSRNMESVMSDYLFRSRGQQAWDERLVLIEIDQRSLDALGWFPWKRDRYAELLQRLSQGPQNTVVFDLVFSEETPEDTLFQAAMQQHQWVVLGSGWTQDNQIWQPTELLRRSAISMGHIVYQVDPLDRHLLQIAPAYEQDKQQVPALAIAALQAARLGGTQVPLIPSDQILTINWPGPLTSLPKYSFVDVLQGKVGLEQFADKIILVGITAPGIDQITIPFDWLNNTHGVHIHAAAIHNYLHQNSLQRFPVAGIPGLIVALGVVWGIWVIVLKAHRHLWTIGLAPLGWLGLTCLVFRYNYRLPVILPILLFVSISCIALWQERQRLVQYNQQLTYQVTVDALTQVKNRYFLEQSLEQLWRRMVRHRGEVALILCDIDHFKLYNDTQGHPTGDHCLYQVAQAIQSCIKRSEDFVARYGGEEFLVVLPNTGILGAVQLTEQMQASLDHLALVHPAVPEPGIVTLSLGIAVGIVNDQSALDLVQKADQALYLAKRLGRNRYVVADDLVL